MSVLEPGAQFCQNCGRKVASGDFQPGPSADARPIQQAEQSPAQPATGPSGHGGHAAFELYVAKPKAMLVGHRSLVYVRFRAKSDLYDSVEFVLRKGTDVLARRFCCEGRPLTEMHSATFDVTPRCGGVVRLAIDAICRVQLSSDICEETHTAFFDVAVDERSPLSSMTVNISQVQTSDRAGDTKGGDINVNLADLARAGAKDSGLDRYETSTDTFSPLVPRLCKSPSRLTLKAGNVAIQLLSDNIVAFGRQSDNAIVLRICDERGVYDRDANEYNGGYKLSRHQFEIGTDGRTCFVRDGHATDGGCTASAYGTRVDGVPVPHATVSQLPSGREVRLGMGPEDAEFKMAATFRRDAMGRAAGVAITRGDGADQRIFIVWREVQTGSRDTVIWTGGCWALRNGDASTIPLSIGTSVEIDGRELSVMPFHQTHI